MEQFISDKLPSSNSLKKVKVILNKLDRIMAIAEVVLGNLEDTSDKKGLIQVNSSSFEDTTDNLGKEVIQIYSDNLEKEESLSIQVRDKYDNWLGIIYSRLDKDNNSEGFVIQALKLKGKGILIPNYITYNSIKLNGITDPNDIQTLRITTAPRAARDSAECYKGILDCVANIGYTSERFSRKNVNSVALMRFGGKGIIEVKDVLFDNCDKIRKSLDMMVGILENQSKERVRRIV